MACCNKIKCCPDDKGGIFDNLTKRLNKRITIEQENITSDSGGGYDLNWVVLDEIWAEIKPKSGWERLRDEQLEPSITHTITIRYRADLQESMRINYNGRLFNIRALINPYEQDIILEILTQENVSQ